MPFVLINKMWQSFDILPTPASFSSALEITTFLRLRVSLPYVFFYFSMYICILKQYKVSFLYF